METQLVAVAGGRAILGGGFQAVRGVLMEHPANPPVKAILSGVEGAEALALLREAYQMLQTVDGIRGYRIQDVQNWIQRYDRLMLRE